MGLIIKPKAIKIDDTDLTSSIPLSTTTTLRTYTGSGSVQIVARGNGHIQVQVLYSVDGGADVVVTTSDVTAFVSVGFNTSLVVKVKNLDGVGAHPSSDVSTTGLYSV